MPDSAVSNNPFFLINSLTIAGVGGTHSLHRPPPLSLLPLPSLSTSPSLDQHPCRRGLRLCCPRPHLSPSSSLLPPSPLPSSLLSSSLLPLSPSPSSLLATSLPLSSRVLLPSPLPLSPSLTRHPCHRSQCFHRHRPRHCHLIVVLKRWAMASAAAMARRSSDPFHRHRPRHRRLIASKRWAMATAAAMAALRAMAFGDCGSSSSDDGGCRDNGGEDNGDGGNGVGDDRPCCPCHCPLRHP
jgi:hypothetical protein